MQARIFICIFYVWFVAWHNNCDSVVGVIPICSKVFQ